VKVLWSEGAAVIDAAAIAHRTAMAGSDLNILIVPAA
jgi:hypothetical protein